MNEKILIGKVIAISENVIFVLTDDNDTEKVYNSQFAFVPQKSDKVFLGIDGKWHIDGRNSVAEETIQEDEDKLSQSKLEQRYDVRVLNFFRPYFSKKPPFATRSEYWFGLVAGLAIFSLGYSISENLIHNVLVFIPFLIWTFYVVSNVIVRRGRSIGLKLWRLAVSLIICSIIEIANLHNFITDTLGTIAFFVIVIDLILLGFKSTVIPDQEGIFSPKNKLSEFKYRNPVLYSRFTTLITTILFALTLFIGIDYSKINDQYTVQDDRSDVMEWYKTVESEDGSVMIRIPKTWNIDETKEEGDLISVANKNNSLSICVSIICEGDDAEFPLQDFASDLFNESFKNDPEFSNVSEIIDSKISGYKSKGITYDGTCENGDMYKSKCIVFKASERYYMMQQVAISSEYSKNQKLMDEITETLRIED
ncbi:MAG: hypothetical protein LBN08_02550 [Lactobacillales bacterium]|jgi:hypothetical protein|nr:hypothetical protein [Lactobacillales bacterium]